MRAELCNLKVIWGVSLFVISSRLSGAGKPTLAYVLEKTLRDMGLNVKVLDGDVIGSKSYPGLGFSEKERVMHSRVVVEMAKRFSKNGVLRYSSLQEMEGSMREIC